MTANGWTPIATARTDTGSARVSFSAGTGEFSYGDSRKPVTAAGLARLDGLGVLSWDRPEYREAVLRKAGTDAVPCSPVAGPAGLLQATAEDIRQEGTPRFSTVRPQEQSEDPVGVQESSPGDFMPRNILTAFMGSRKAVYAVSLLALAVSLAAFALGYFRPPALTGPASRAAAVESPQRRLAAYLGNVDAVIADSDGERYAAMVDVGSVGRLMERSTLAAYDSLPSDQRTAKGSAAIARSYEDYPQRVSGSVKAGDTGGVPLAGLSAGEMSSEGSTVTVTVRPRPSDGASLTTVPDSGGKVYYVFSVKGDGIRLLAIDGLVPYLQGTALRLAGTAK